MDADRLLEILQSVSDGIVTPDAALERLRTLPYEDIGFAKIDLHRGIRQGFPEVIFCPGKTAEQIAAIATRLKAHHKLVLASRATTDQADFVLKKLDGAVYHELARMIVFGRLPEPDDLLPVVSVVAAGTADLPIAEEAALVLQSAGVPLNRVTDVGVAGIHRLLGNLESIRAGSVTIVIAGMDGALPSVVAGLLDQPVIAVPTSVGYGASFEGLAALLSMLNSCASGLTVVNIDNGFGAAVAAIRIVQTISKLAAKSGANA